MHSVEGRQLVGWWLAVAALASAVLVAAHLPALLAQPRGWRALAGPAAAAALSAVAAARLLCGRGTGGWRLAAGVAGAQVLALSAGPVAYRLVAGPFVSVALAPTPGVRAGTDAHLLLIVGSGNRVPPGAAVNLTALLALIIVAASARHDRHRAPAS